MTLVCSALGFSLLCQHFVCSEAVPQYLINHANLQMTLSIFYKGADLDVLYHPILNAIYYTLVEIVPSALVLYILRKMPPKRMGGQYHPIR
jgi:hypothetical protein